MKKLLFATALVASAAAFADGAPTALNAISFEGYTADSNVTVGNKSDSPDTQTGSTTAYFCYTDGDQDGSTVKAYGVGDNLAAPGTRTAYFAQLLGQSNANYLELSTEGGILWRSINQADSSGSTYSLGTATNVASTGLYLDTLVQFTPTEDGGTPDLTSDDKLAIWLNVDSSATPPVTNLMVRAAYVEDTGSVVCTPTNFSASCGKDIVPGQWYRLTVKAVADVTKAGADNAENAILGFLIFIDNDPVVATDATFASSYIDTATDADFGWIPVGDTTTIPLLQSKTVFPSLKGLSRTATLQGVGFKGSGALDDIVWTEEDPFANTPGSQTDDYKVEIAGSDVVITPQEGDLAAVQAAVIAGGGTLDVTDVAAVNAALAAEIGSTGIPRWQALFLGLPPTEAGLESFKINSISFNEDGEVVVTLPAAVDPKTGRGVNITLKLKKADTPNAAAADWTDVESASGTTFAPFAPGSTDTKKFYKVVVEFAATPAQN